VLNVELSHLDVVTNIIGMEKAKDELGILHFMNKPFNVFELREQVRKIF